MRIVAYECRKALTSPVLLGLAFVFLCFNIFLIVDRSDLKDELKVVNQIVASQGVQITDESLHRFQQHLQTELSKLNERIMNQANEKYNSIHAFLETLRHEDWEQLSEADRAFIAELQIKEMHYHMAIQMDERYNQVDWRQIGEGEIVQLGLSGKTADYFRDAYAQLVERVEQIKLTDAHKTWFFAGVYHMHSFLFRTIFAALIFEALMLSVLTTALITNYEFEHRTHLVMYATAEGRRLKKDKFIASMISAATVTVFLIGATLAVYFTIFDYSHVWGSMIGSVLNWEYERPYVPWRDLTFLSFLLWSMLLIFASVMIFNVLTFAVSVLTRNNYYTFFLMAAFFGLLFIMPLLMPSLFGLKSIVQFNLSQLLMNPHQFFMGNASIPMMSKHYELITLLVWGIIAAALSWLMLKMFKTQDIH